MRSLCVWMLVIGTVACRSSGGSTPLAPTSGTASVAGGSPAPLPAPWLRLTGTMTPTAVDGPVNCFSKPFYDLLALHQSLTSGSWQLSQSGPTVTLESVYPIDDGTWSNYVTFVGPRDGTAVTLTYSSPSSAWSGCNDLPPQTITEDDELVGTLSGDNPHLDAVNTRRLHTSAGDLLATWHYSLAQQ